MYRHLVERFERESRNFTKRDVSLSDDSFYIGEQNSLYKKVIVDGRETKIRVDLFKLQESVGRGTVTEQVKAVVAQVILG